MPNIFKDAKRLLNTKKSSEMTEVEQLIVSAALIPLNLRDCPFPEDMTIDECLEELARTLDGE